MGLCFIIALMRQLMKKTGIWSSRDLEQPHLYPLHDPINTLVYCGKSSDVEAMIITQVVVQQR